MKRAEEFEIWERSKRKEQKYIRTKNSSTKIYYLPKNHNDSTLTALENTMDEIDEEIRTAREIFEEELQKISSRAEQNPNAVRLHNTIKYICDQGSVPTGMFPYFSHCYCYYRALKIWRATITLEMKMRLTKQQNP